MVRNLRKKLDTEESRQFWERAREASIEVETWPAWKREYPVTRHTLELYKKLNLQNPYQE